MTWEPFVGSRIYLDANALIYMVEQGTPWTKTLNELADRLEAGTIAAVTSDLTLAEVLVRPLREGATDVAAIYEDITAPGGTIEIVPADRRVFIRAARLRADHHLKLYDAIHLASAEQAACSHFLTHDLALGRRLPSPLRWLTLMDVEAKES